MSGGERAGSEDAGQRAGIRGALLSRRAVIGGALLGAAGLALDGCGVAAKSAAGDGSTLHSTWVDREGDGQLQVGPGEALLARSELGEPARITGELARFAHLTDAHVLDASSPARVPFLARLGPPVQSTFRPQEALTAQVLHGAVNAVRQLDPQVVIQGGDLIDNDQSNELDRAVRLLGGGRVDPGSGRDGYYGVQLASDPDPFYYRPDIDAPRHPGMLTAAVRPFTSGGLGADWIPVLGDHDALVAGELVPSELTRGLAVGNRALWSLPADLKLPAGLKLSGGGSPDGPPDPEFVTLFLQQALAGPTVQVPADASRYELSFADVAARMWSGSRAGAQAAVSAAGSVASGARLDFVRDVGDHLRLIVLDIVRRDGGSGGLVADGQLDWLSGQLADAGRRWVIVVSHQPLSGAEGGDGVLSRLDTSPRVIATLAGHIHRNQVLARKTAAGGYWMITTSSLIDYPQQCRALRLVSTSGGGVALQTWMLDHVGNGSLGPIARELAYLDAEGGRPMGFAGDRGDRNATLYRALAA